MGRINGDSSRRFSVPKLQTPAVPHAGQTTAGFPPGYYTGRTWRIVLRADGDRDNLREGSAGCTTNYGCDSFYKAAGGV